MTDDDAKKKMAKLQDETNDQDEGGKSGTGGQVEFRDFLNTNHASRDDLLSYEEKKHLLAIHRDAHELRVKKQKERRDNYKQLKDGKMALQDYRQSMYGFSEQYKINPVLANKAQFSGIDRQVNMLPNENIAESNQDKREELAYQYSLRYSPQNMPRFHPKPQYR